MQADCITNTDANWDETETKQTGNWLQPLRSFFISNSSGAVGPVQSLPKPSPSFHPIFSSSNLPIGATESVDEFNVADVDDAVDLGAF